MTAAVKDVFPRSLHMFCMWHTVINVTKKCQVALQGNFKQMLSHFKAAAVNVCTTVFNYSRASLCFPYEQRILYLPTTSDTKKKKWAFFFHPGALTLGITSTQRVEAINGVLKKTVVGRDTTLVELEAAM
ncbi:unnamed protein product, partial [Laminaria digitata]